MAGKVSQDFNGLGKLQFFEIGASQRAQMKTAFQERFNISSFLCGFGMTQTKSFFFSNYSKTKVIELSQKGTVKHKRSGTEKDKEKNEHTCISKYWLDPIKKLVHLKFCYAGLEHCDWSTNFEQPIGGLQTSIDLLHA